MSLDVRRLLLSPKLRWSGNVRQLERAVIRARERALALDPDAEALRVEHFDDREIGLEGEGNAVEPESATVATRWRRLQQGRVRMDEEEKEVLREALNEAGGVVSQMARDLGIARTTLACRLDALGLRTSRNTER